MADLGAILLELLVPDSARIHAAEQALAAVVKRPEIIPQLVEQIKSSPHAPVRSISAVIMRRRIFKHWGRIPPNVQLTIKADILHSLANEPDHLARKSVANLVAAMSKLTLAAGQWPDLLNFLFQCTQSQFEHHREIAAMLFGQLCDSVPDQIEPHIVPLQKIFLAAIKDASPKVRRQGLRGMSSLIAVIETSETASAPDADLILALGTVTKQSLEQGDEDAAMEAFQIFDELTTAEHSLLRAHLSPLIHLCLEAALMPAAPLTLRRKAVEVGATIVGFFPKAVGKDVPLLTATIHSVMELCCVAEEERDEEEEDEEQSDDDEPLFRAASSALDALCQQLSSGKVLPLLLSFCDQNKSHADAFRRRGVQVILAAASEGCRDALIKQLNVLLPFILMGLQDPDHRVRLETCGTIAMYANFLMPELTEHMSTLFPAIIHSLSDPSPPVSYRAAVALDAVCEAGSPEDEEAPRVDVTPYLQQSVEGLFRIMGQNSMRAKEVSVSALASLATAAGASFAPFFEQTANPIRQFMTLTDPEQLTLRARATECLGLLAASSGKEAARPIFSSAMQTAMEGLALGCSELREYTFSFFANCAETMDVEFIPLVPPVVEEILKTLEEEEAWCVSYADDDNEHQGPVLNLGDDGESDDDDEEDVHGKRRIRGLSVKTSTLNEKSSALLALGTIAENTRHALVPVSPRCFEACEKMIQHFSEDVRTNAAVTMYQLFGMHYDAHNPAPESGTLIQQLHPDTIALFHRIIHLYQHVLEKDDDKDVVVKACEGIAALLDKAGPSCMNEHLGGVMAALKKLLCYKGTCQGIEDEDDEETDHQLVIDGAADTIGTIAAHFQVNFLPHFHNIYPTLLDLLGQKRHDDDDRCAAIGAVAEVASAIGSPFGPYISPTIPALLTCLAYPSEETQRNAVFCLGVFCEVDWKEMVPHLSRILPLLPPFLAAETDPYLRDNATAAIARMIKSCAAFESAAGTPTASSHLPLANLVQAMMTHLPLNHDKRENGAVIRCIVFVMRSHPDLMGPHIANIVRYFAALLAQPSLSEEIKSADEESVKSTLVALFQQFPTEMHAVVASLPDAWKAALPTA